MWRAAQRIRSARLAEKQVVVVHMADHDPSGVDMTRDVEDRLERFDAWQGVQVERLALTMGQVNHYNPPAFWAKMTDSRASEYVANYGPDAWELDALEPKVIDELIEETVERYIDHDIWSDTLSLESDMESVLQDALDLVQGQDQWARGWTVLDGRGG
jgi:hypothetical protein